MNSLPSRTPLTGARAFAALLTTTMLSAPALADSAAAGDANASDNSDQITVVGSRLPTQVEDVPATVSVITAEQIDDELMTDIKDLVRFEPGVTVRRQPTRFGAALGTTGRSGNSGFTIRGIGGNRTLMLIDGVRVPDGFSFGAQDVGRGDYVDLGLVKQVEILRGPASALYGSDGLSGAVAFTLSEPADFLAGGSIGGLARAAYSSADEEFAETAIIAAGGGSLSAMAAYTRRDFHELDNQGENDVEGAARTTPNPQDGHSNALLGRIVFEPGGGHKLRLTGEYIDSYLFTAVLSGRSASVLDLTGTDTGERVRVAADWSWTRAEQAGDGLDHAQIGVYWQDAEDRQFTAEDRNPAADRTRLNSFENRAYGASGELRAALTTGALAHRVVVGADVSVLRQRGLRDGTVPPSGETFPTRAFPETDFTSGGAFIGDEITVGDGAVTLFPALRFDAYKLDAQDDPLLPSFVGADQSDSRFSPRFGAIVRVVDGLSLFANYASGFNAPEPSQINQFFENLTSPFFAYRTLPNPDLRPETSESFEGGVRISTRNASLSLTAFQADYDDFISQVQVGGVGTVADPILFQFVNIGQVEVSGFEARADVDFSSGVTGRFALAYAHGDELLDGGARTPLASIDPLTLVGGLGYRDPGGRFGAELVATHHARKEAGRARGACSSECYRPDSATVLDATAFVRLFDALTLRAGVFNLTDETYAVWSDVHGLSLAADPTQPGAFVPPAAAPAYTRPGRNVSASISFRF